MTLEESIRVHLVNSVPALGDRVYQGALYSQATLPAVTIETPSDTPYTQHQGRTTTFRSRVQLDVWAKSITERDTVAQAVRDAMDNYRAAGGPPLLSVRVKYGRNPNSNLFRFSFDYFVIHNFD